MATVQITKYGANELGTPYCSGASWFRRDIYTSRKTGETFEERRFAAGRDDLSPMFIDGEHGRYDARCSCCWLNFSHTVAEHNQSIAAAASERKY